MDPLPQGRPHHHKENQLPGLIMGNRPDVFSQSWAQTLRPKKHARDAPFGAFLFIHNWWPISFITNTPIAAVLTMLDNWLLVIHKETFLLSAQPPVLTNDNKCIVFPDKCNSSRRVKLACTNNRTPEIPMWYMSRTATYRYSGNAAVLMRNIPWPYGFALH